MTTREKLAAGLSIFALAVGIGTVAASFDRPGSGFASAAQAALRMINIAATGVIIISLRSGANGKPIGIRFYRLSVISPSIRPKLTNTGVIGVTIMSRQMNMQNGLLYAKRIFGLPRRIDF